MASFERFIVKHYVADASPSIKGYGFDGLRVGEDREEAEEFIDWINARLATLEAIANINGAIRENEWTYADAVAEVQELAKRSLVRA